ncbi:MAG: universal stress protein [Humibacillus sp.]|nr:universal stress protein [Humibacillus sp.]MDN5779471.1 universal stress protein [Humibacillus sp.]
MSDQVAAEPRQEHQTVVGVDGSAASAQALRWACEHVSANGEPGEVLAVCVRTIAPLPEDLSIGTWPWRDGDPGDPVLAMLDEIAGQVGRDFPLVTIRRQVLQGHPVDELIRLSETAELVIVGARGHGAIAGMLLGSVSRRLINHSHCSVAVVR